MSNNNGYAKARPVIGPDGAIYASLREASRATGIELTKLHRLVSASKSGWQYVAPTPAPKGRKPREHETPMAIDEAIAILELLPEIRGWITNRIIHATKTIQARLQSGETVEGFELKELPGSPRCWIDEKAAADALLALGIPASEIFALKPPSKIDELLQLAVRCGPLENDPDSWMRQIDFDALGKLEELCIRDPRTTLKDNLQ